MSYHNIPSSATQSVTNTQGQVAPSGSHYMPDGTLMADAVHARLYGTKVIQSFDLDLSDINASGETRAFTINGSNNSEFKLEIKNEDNYYYNFVTNTFQVTQNSLEVIAKKGTYHGKIIFPTVTDDDQYDIYLYAVPGTEHAPYSEVRFGDGSMDINSSIGSNSLMMQKVIYQYTDVTLTITTFSTSAGVETGSKVDKAIVLSRGKSLSKTPFKISCAVTTATKSYRIKKQPTHLDIISFVSPVIGSAPIDLPGENIYPTATAAFIGDDVNGAVTSGSVVRMDNTDLSAVIAVGDKITTAITEDTVDGAVTSGVRIVMDANVATKMAVGDQVTVDGNSRHFFNTNQVLVTHLDPDGDNAKEFQIDAIIQSASIGGVLDGQGLLFSSKINRSTTTVTVVETSSTATDFTHDQEIQFRDNAPLTFTPRKNFSWPITKANLIQSGMIVLQGSSASTIVSPYEDKIIIFEGTKDEEVIIKNARPAISTVGKTPTIVNGLITAQDGDVVFNKQQVLALAGDTLKIGGYGESEILRLYGYEVRFSDLKIKLTPITTTTTAASAGGSSTSVVVASRNGILDGISTASGIGINPAAVNPTVASGAGAVSGAGTIVLSAAQSLEDGITLTFKGAGQTATITGNIEILKTGMATDVIRFDVDKLLSIT